MRPFRPRQPASLHCAPLHTAFVGAVAERRGGDRDLPTPGEAAWQLVDCVCRAFGAAATPPPPPGYPAFLLGWPV